jgi:perosamine synthetase
MIPVNTPFLNGNEKKYLNECIDTGWISSEGPFVQKFEKNMASYNGRKYATACASGSAALDIAVKALGLKKDDEVIIPSFTIISCAQSLVKLGIKPVLVDSHYETFNMKVEDIEEKITPQTKAIMIVHVFGLSADIDPILKIAKKYNLKIIEDAAEVIGQEYKGKKCGSFGDISTLSFYPNKHVTTGEGGMLLTDDEELDKRAKSLRNLCFSLDPNKRFIHEDLGWNYRMTNMQAALGVAQFEQIDKMIEKKRHIGNTYNKLLKDIKVINLPIAKTDYCENIYWVYAITLKDDYKKTAKEVMSELKDYKIGSRPFFYPMHKQPVFNNMGLFLNEDLPQSEKLYEKGFYIPSGLALTNAQMIEVAEVLHKVLVYRH